MHSAYDKTKDTNEQESGYKIKIIKLREIVQLEKVQP